MSSKKSRSSWWILVILVVVFVVPVMLAWSLYHAKHSWTGKTVNEGQLLNPPLSITSLNLFDLDHRSIALSYFHGRWGVFFIAPAPCNRVCQQNIYHLRQVWLALGKNQDRVQRVLVLYPFYSDPKLIRQLRQGYAGTECLFTTSEALSLFLGSSRFSDLEKGQGAFYVMDPHGNVMMTYPSSVIPEGIFNDLTRLLRVSQIG